MATNMPEQGIGELELVESQVTTEDAAIDETSTGVSENVLGGLSYLFGFVSGLLVYFLEDNEFARYHAAQSIALSAAVVAVSLGLTVVGTIGTIVLDNVPVIGLLFGLGMLFVWLAVWLGSIGVWLYAMISAFRGKRTRLPVVTGIAEQYLL